MRVVLDTNVLVSAFIRTRGRVTSLWQAARERRYRLVLSPVIISEVAETLRKDFHWEERRLVNRSKLMARTAEMVVPRLLLDVVRDDPDDNRILECAVGMCSRRKSRSHCLWRSNSPPTEIVPRHSHRSADRLPANPWSCLRSDRDGRAPSTKSRGATDAVPLR